MRNHNVPAVKGRTQTSPWGQGQAQLEESSQEDHLHETMYRHSPVTQGGEAKCATNSVLCFAPCVCKCLCTLEDRKVLANIPLVQRPAYIIRLWSIQVNSMGLVISWGFCFCFFFSVECSSVRKHGVITYEDWALETQVSIYFKQHLHDWVECVHLWSPNGPSLRVAFRNITGVHLWVTWVVLALGLGFDWLSGDNHPNF